MQVSFFQYGLTWQPWVVSLPESSRSVYTNMSRLLVLPSLCCYCTYFLTTSSSCRIPFFAVLLMLPHYIVHYTGCVTSRQIKRHPEQYYEVYFTTVNRLIQMIRKFLENGNCKHFHVYRDKFIYIHMSFIGGDVQSGCMGTRLSKIRCSV